MPPPQSPVFTYLEGHTPIHRHEHVAILYRGRTAAFSQAGFLSEGLAAGDQCCYLAPSAFQAEMLSRLRTLGADLDHHLRTRTLLLQRGMSGSRELLEWTQHLFIEAERARRPAVRWLDKAPVP